jgi:hypothetical protein
MLSVSCANVIAHHAVRRSSAVEAAGWVAASRWMIRGDAVGAASKRLPGAAMCARQVA